MAEFTVGMPLAQNCSTSVRVMSMCHCVQRQFSVPVLYAASQLGDTYYYYAKDNLLTIFIPIPLPPFRLLRLDHGGHTAFFFFFFFCLTWHRGGKCGELLRSPKTSPECGFVALRQVLVFSSPFKAGTATTGSDNLLQLCLDLDHGGHTASNVAI